MEQAADGVLDLLVGLGYEMPSLYVARGGRLRCISVRGYDQVLDGIRPGGSVIGAVYATGVARVIGDVVGSADFKQAVPGVVAEVAVPIRLRGSVIGVLNAEFMADIPDGAAPTLERCAAAFATRLGELGGPPPESPAQTLARHAVELASTSDGATIAATLATSACEVVGMASALVVLDQPGPLPQRTGSGKLGDALVALPDAVVREITSWVRSGASAYSTARSTGESFVGGEAVESIGACSILALPLEAGGTWLGLLVLADPAIVPIRTEAVERGELLAAQASSVLLNARLLADLRHEAGIDPLTRLGHHGAFTEAVQAAHDDLTKVGSIAVIVLDIDNFKAVNDEHGHPHGDGVLLHVVGLMAGALRDGDRLYRVGGDEFAAVLSVADEHDAVRIAERVRLAVEQGDGGTISIGVAVSGWREAATAMVQRADRALYEAKRKGRNNVAVAKDD